MTFPTCPFHFLNKKRFVASKQQMLPFSVPVPPQAELPQSIITANWRIIK
jgi:hypothetical protein